MATIMFNFTGLNNIYKEALKSYDKTVAFDIRIGRGRFLFLMFLGEDDERDNLFLYMRTTAVMCKLKMYGSHKSGDFKIYITDEQQKLMMAELQLQEGNEPFDFIRFLNQLNQNIPQEINIDEKIRILRDNRDVISEVGIEEAEKTVLIGTRTLSNGKPKDKTLRKLYMFTDADVAVTTELINNLKKYNMTVAWTTEDQRFRAADINNMINEFR